MGSRRLHHRPQININPPFLSDWLLWGLERRQTNVCLSSFYLNSPPPIGPSSAGVPCKNLVLDSSNLQYLKASSLQFAPSKRHFVCLFHPYPITLDQASKIAINPVFFLSLARIRRRKPSGSSSSGVCKVTSLSASQGSQNLASMLFFLPGHPSAIITRGQLLLGHFDPPECQFFPTPLGRPALTEEEDLGLSLADCASATLFGRYGLPASLNNSSAFQTRVLNCTLLCPC